MELNGPLFDGRASALVPGMLDEIEMEVGDEGVSLVRARLNQVLKKQTPFYITKIENAPRRGDRVVTGESVIYHWWLEGKGSRNFPATRFRGYRTFELTAPVLAGAASAIAERVMRPFVAKMGGR